MGSDREDQDGVTLNFLTSREEKDDRALTITPSGHKVKKPKNISLLFMDLKFHIF